MRPWERVFDRLDEFGTRETKYAYKQIEEMINTLGLMASANGAVRQNKQVAF